MRPVIAIDPGENAGYAAISDATPVQRRFGSYPPVIAVGHAFVEVKNTVKDCAYVSEYQYARKDIRRDTTIKLAFRAGWLLRQAGSTTDQFALTPREWKNLLFRNGVQLRKDVFCARVEAMLTDAERGLLGDAKQSHRLDILDAIGLGWAFQLIADPEPYRIGMNHGRLNVRKGKK